MGTREVDIIAPDKLRDVLVTRTAIKTFKSEAVVEKVISHQLKEARDGLKRYSEVEISGFGKFMLSQHKLVKKINRYEKFLIYFQDELLKADTDKKKESIEIRINGLLEELAYLKSKRK